MNTPQNTSIPTLTGGNHLKGEDWGLWERFVPGQVLDGDPAGQRIAEIHFRRYETALNYVKDKRVLDIACGTGYGTQMLALGGAKSVVGVDVSQESVRYAQQTYQAPGVEFICANAEQFECLDPFETIISFETLEHLLHPDQFLQRLHRLLVPQGTLLLSVPLGETRHLDPYHLHAFQQEEVFALLDRSGFSVELHRVDDWFVPRSSLLQWQKLYPDSQASLGDLFLTRRGLRTLWDFIWQGGFRMPSLLVIAHN